MLPFKRVSKCLKAVWVSPIDPTDIGSFVHTELNGLGSTDVSS